MDSGKRDKHMQASSCCMRVSELAKSTRIRVCCSGIVGVEEWLFDLEIT